MGTKPRRAIAGLPSSARAVRHAGRLAMDVVPGLRIRCDWHPYETRSLNGVRIDCVDAMVDTPSRVPEAGSGTWVA
jgi:hypothetical protein